MTDGEVTAVELALGERKFLHEISNKLIVVQGMSATVLKRVKSGEPFTEKEMIKLEKVLKAAEAMVELLQDRRATLMEVSVSEEESS